jgi:hypothetical protein
MNWTDEVTHVWIYLQGLLDINGDCVMLFFSAAVVYKILHGGLNNADACAYSTAIGALGYSKGVKKGEPKL